MDPLNEPGEQLLAQWEQPVLRGSLGRGSLSLIFLIAAAILGILAFWQKELNYALAGAVLIVTLFATRTAAAAGGQIAITTTQVIIGKRAYPLADFGGFWLSHSQGHVEVNLEGKKHGLVPLTFLANEIDDAPVRNLFAQILPETAPREHTLGESLNRYFRL